jgi:hypothetical protein
MAALPCCTEGTWKRSAAPRVDWPVYPRRAEHNTIAEVGNRRWAEIARQNAFQSRWPEADQRTPGRGGGRPANRGGRQQAGALGRRRGQTGKFSAVPVPAVYEASRRQPVRRDVRQKTPPRARAQASVWPENGRDGMARWGDSQKPEIGNFPARSSCQPPSRRRPIWGRWQCSPALSAWATSR